MLGEDQDTTEFLKEIASNIKILASKDPVNQSVESLMLNSEGSVSITVSRSSANIPYPLPYVILAPNDLQGGYTTSLSAIIQETLLPVAPDVTYAVSFSANGDVKITYTNGAASDVIIIRYLGNLNKYNSFLKAMNNDYFRSKLMLYSISDPVNGGAQLQNIITVGTIGSLGLATQNEIPLQACVLPQDNPNNGRIAVIYPETDFTPNTGVVDSIIPCPAADIAAEVPFVVMYNIFMSRRINLNQLPIPGVMLGEEDPRVSR